MVRAMLKEVFAKVKVEPGSRDQVLDACIKDMQRLIKDTRKFATTLDLHKVDWLYHGMHELRLAKTLTREEVGMRIAILKDIQSDETDPDDQVLASASLEAISIASKHIRSNT
jgi:hypothetical protein